MIVDFKLQAYKHLSKVGGFNGLFINTVSSYQIVEKLLSSLNNSCSYQIVEKLL